VGSTSVPPLPRILVLLGWLLLLVLAVPPLLLEGPGVAFLPSRGLIPDLAACLGLEAALLGVVGILARLDGRDDPWDGRRTLILAFLAVVLTFLHWLEVDRHPYADTWQRNLYLGLFAHTYEPPHQYRPLPYGFVRSLEHLTHHWELACAAYRWFFTFLFLRAAWMLARRYLPPLRADLVVLILCLLYPLSVARYLGQLTDPLSHFLFVVGTFAVLRGQPWTVAVALAFGVAAKETAVVLVPVYLLAWWSEKGWRAVGVSVVLGLVAVAAFLATRLPLGWRPGATSLNGAGLMIGTNLGIGEPEFYTYVPLIENYCHPLLFFGPFLPFLVRHWNQRDEEQRRLVGVGLGLSVLVLASNVAFGWLYESRNYMPVVPVLATGALMSSSCPSGRRPQTPKSVIST
jgi:hypothetical protein